MWCMYIGHIIFMWTKITSTLPGICFVIWRTEKLNNKITECKASGVLKSKIKLLLQSRHLELIHVA